MASKRSFIVIAGLMLVGAVFGACKSNSGSGATCPTGSTVTYDNFGKAFFQTNCLRCHSSTTKQQNPELDTVDAIRTNKTDIDEEAASGPNATNAEMPEDGAAVALADRQKLGEWLACGAP